MVVSILNYNQCIKSVENFGSITYINICTGQRTVVPWGQMDFILPPVFIILMIAIVVLAYRTLHREPVGDFDGD